MRTGARLRLKLAHLGLRWWKFYNAARFELWRVDAQGKRTEKVRTGPKVSYCLRDLTHTRPTLPPRSPYLPHYPACSTNVTLRQDTLGTSVGWADIYPPSYPEQWIDVTGLRGCFAYVHIADPENGVYESNEDNNEAQVIVRLPFRPRRPAPGLPRARPRARARPAAVPGLGQPVGRKRSVRTCSGFVAGLEQQQSWRPPRTRSSRTRTRCRPVAQHRGVDPTGAGPAIGGFAREGELGLVAELVRVDHVLGVRTE